MIKRIVKLEFEPSNIDAFKAIFLTNKDKIKNFEGCHDVNLLQDIHQANVFFTYSHWESQTHLDNYRNSALFAGVWKKTKALFNNKPFAWSVQEIL